MVHEHRPYLLFQLNEVRCKDFECNSSTLATETLEGALPDKAQVVFANNGLSGVTGPKAYIVRVDNEYWCTMIGLVSGVLLIDGFKGSKQDFAVFQHAIFVVFEIYNVHDGKKIHTFSLHEFEKQKKEKKDA